MTDDTSRPSRRSWKGEDRSARRARGPDALWKRRAREEGRPAPFFSRNARIVWAAIACLFGIGLIVWLILMIAPVRPASVILVGADYATNLAVPHNVFGWEGLQGIRALTLVPRDKGFWSRPGLRGARPDRIALKDATHWDEVLDNLKSKGFSGDTIVIVLALHGASDASGKAYLLPASATKPSDGVELATILDGLKALPARKTKVLVLEAAQVPADWHLGMVHNGVMRRLRELDREGKITEVPNLWILSAADVDQRCWASDGLRQTVFTHYLIEGLRGEAAGPDRRVSLAELHEYVRQNVRNWVWDARRAVQEPVLLPKPTPRRDAQRVVLALASDRPPPPPKPPLEPELPRLLEQRWQEFDRLAKLDPHPTVYMPRRWTAYRAALVRYDQLVRAGAAAPSQQEIAGMLDRLRGQIEKERRERFRSLGQSVGNSLALNALRGGTVSLSPSAALNHLWDAPDPDLDKAIANYQTEATGGDPRLPSAQARAESFLYQRAEDDPRANLAKAAARLAKLQPPDAPLSAEAQFLIMLDRGLRNLPADRPAWYWDLVQQALRVRRTAERAALGVGPEPADFTPCEQIVPWIAALIEQADRSRRLGEDLLFASEASSWNDARAALGAAEQGYQKATDRAEVLRRAIAQRDRSLADIPQYARWLVYRAATPADDARLKELRDILGWTHDLARRLQQSSADLDVADLARRTDRVRAAIDAIEQEFVAGRGQLDSARRPEDWNDATVADASAPVHFDPLPLRRSLWRRLANIAARDLEIDRPDLARQAGPTEADRLSDRVQTLRRACEQALTALAVLGRDLLDAPDLQAWDDRTPEAPAIAGSRPPEEGYDDLVARLGRLLEPLSREIKAEGDLNDLLAPERRNGYGLLGQAGGQIGRRWRGLPPAINRLVNEGNPALAARFNRMADGVVAASDESAPEAASVFRDARTRDALAWLAERTWLDHWYDTNPASPPYYQAAGQRYLDDFDLIVQMNPAKGALNTPKVPGGARPWPRTAQAVRELYSRKDRLDFDRPAAPVLTSELSAKVWFALTGMDADLAGAPVVWAEPEAESRLKLEGPTPGQRIAWEQHTGGKSPPALAFAFSSPALEEATPKPARPVTERTAMTARGSFRGRPFERKIDVVLYPVPETLVSVPPLLDRAASIAVRADREVVERFGEGSGAIAIVLDCSGSMGRDEEGTKFHDARKALATVLRSAVPRGTTVSVWAFGQELRGYDRYDPIAVENNRNPEKTIKRLVGPVRWDPSQVVTLDQQLDRIEPVHGTPLVQAMDKAAEDLDLFDGFKTLLVLTDGKDTRFAADDAFNPTKLSIPAFLAKRFGRSGIGINMVGFKIEDKELAEAKAQFADALAQLDPPGRFIPVGESQRLVEALRNSLQQKLVCRLRGGDRPRADELDVAAPDESDRWLLKGLAPGHYTLEVQADQTWTKDVDLDPGDRLIVRLVSQSDGSLGFQRALYSDDFPTKKPFAESQRWRLAVLQNQSVPDGHRLRMLAALEPLDDPREYLFLSKPRLTWFELALGVAPAPPFAVQVRPQALSPAPLWRIDVPEWPPVAEGEGPSAPTLRVWWDPEGPRALTTIKRPEEFQTPAAIDRLDVFTGEGDTVTVESVQAETHLVETRPGGPREPMPCLVVRLQYPADKPYWVDPASLADLKIDGHEHRFYTKAGKYTGVFWPVTQARLDADLKRFGLISLARFRKEAERSKQFLELKLGPPRPDEKAPEPPPALRGR